MRIRRKVIYTITTMLILGGASIYALQIPGPRTTIYNSNSEKALNTSHIDNPIRDGTYMIIDNEKTIDPSDENDYTNRRSVGGIVNIGQITEHEQAKESTLDIIKNIINYALGAMSLVALIYLIWHGFMMLTAAGEEDKYKKGLKGIKYAAIAMAGVGLSFFMISFIFRLINLLTTPR